MLLQEFKLAATTNRKFSGQNIQQGEGQDGVRCNSRRRVAREVASGRSIFSKHFRQLATQHVSSTLETHCCLKENIFWAIFFVSTCCRAIAPQPNKSPQSDQSMLFGPSVLLSLVCVFKIYSLQNNQCQEDPRLTRRLTVKLGPQSLQETQQGLKQYNLYYFKRNLLIMAPFLIMDRQDMQLEALSGQVLSLLTDCELAKVLSPNLVEV